MKKIIQNIIILLLAAGVVFIMFYDFTSPSPKEQPNVEIKDTISKTNSAYTNDCRALYLEASKNDSIILASVEVDKKVANKAIKAFADFSFYCPNDTLAPIFLLKAGQIAQSINNIPQAQLSFERIINDFPNFKNRGAAMFLLAQLYDEQHLLNDEEKARELYGQIINTFPNSDWAKNADAARNLLGKTDEQIIKEFEKKNKKK